MTDASPMPDSPRPANTTTPTTLSREHNIVIWVLLAAAFVAILNETTMGVALPHLVTDLGVDELTVQWLTSAFMLTMAVIIPTTGFILQRFSTRAVFFAALGLFSAGTLIAFFAPNFAILLGARVVQASGTAIMMPLLMTTLMNLVPAASRGRMMGRVSVVMSLAPAIGPTMSGVILDALGWRWVFGIVFPIALLALLLGAKYLTNVTETKEAPIDVLSIILSAFGFGGIVYGLSQISTLVRSGPDATPAPLIISLSVGAIGFALFIWRQLVLQKDDGALLDLRVFRSLPFALSIAQIAVLSVAFFGSIIVFPLYLQDAVGISPTDSGLVMLPGALAMGLLGPVIGRVYDASGTRVLLIPGSILTIAVLWFYSTLSASTEIWVLVIAHTILSIGLALSFTPLFTASLAALTPKFYSYGSAVIGTVQQVAGAAGVAIMIAVYTIVMNSEGGKHVAEAVAAGSRAAFLIGAIVAIPTLLGAFLIKKPEEIVETETFHQP